MSYCTFFVNAILLAKISLWREALIHINAVVDLVIELESFVTLAHEAPLSVYASSMIARTEQF